MTDCADGKWGAPVSDVVHLNVMMISKSDSMSDEVEGGSPVNVTDSYGCFLAVVETKGEGLSVDPVVGTWSVIDG